MIVIGWLFITVLGAWFTGGGLLGAYASFGWSGKADPVCWIITAIGAAILYCSYLYFPFDVSMKP